MFALTVALTNHTYLNALNDAYCTMPIFDIGPKTRFLGLDRGFWC